MKAEAPRPHRLCNEKCQKTGVCHPVHIVYIPSGALLAPQIFELINKSSCEVKVSRHVFPNSRRSFTPVSAKLQPVHPAPAVHTLRNMHRRL